MYVFVADKAYLRHLNPLKEHLDLAILRIPKVVSQKQRAKEYRVFNSDFILDLEQLGEYDIKAAEEGINNAYSGIFWRHNKQDSKQIIISYLYSIGKFFEEYLQKNKVEALIVPKQCTGERRLVTSIAKFRNIPVICLEPDFICTFFLICRDSLYDFISNFDWKMIKATVFTDVENKKFESWRNNFIKNKLTAGTDTVKEFIVETISIPSNCVLIVGQSPTDANQLIHQRQIPYDPILIAEKFNNQKIVFKKHPEDKTDTAILLKSKGHIVIEENINIHEVLSQVKYVVTWNSKVGLEALLYYRSVMVLGDIFYRNRGLTFDVDDLTLNFDNFIRFIPNKRLIDQFFKFLICRGFVERDFEKIAQRIKRIKESTENFGLTL